MNEKPQNHWIRNNLIAIFLVSFVPAFYLTTTSSINAPAYWLIVTILALIPANIAAHKGRNYALWFFYGMCLWLIALLHSIFIHDNDKAKAIKGWHKCPHCGEYSKPEATVCHYCGRNLF